MLTRKDREGGFEGEGNFASSGLASSSRNICVDTGDMRIYMRIWLICCVAFCFSWPVVTPMAVAQAPEAAPTFTVSDADLSQNPALLVYGDMRFTDPANTKVANPQ